MKHFPCFISLFLFIYLKKRKLNIMIYLLKEKLNLYWGLGDWGLGIGDWAQSPIPNPQSPIPNPHSNRFLTIF